MLLDLALCSAVCEVAGSIEVHKDFPYAAEHRDCTAIHSRSTVLFSINFFGVPISLELPFLPFGGYKCGHLDTTGFLFLNQIRC